MRLVDHIYQFKKRTVPALGFAALAFASLACNYPAFIPTPTPKVTIAPTKDTSQPTMVPTKQQSSVPTSTAAAFPTLVPIKPTPTRISLNGVSASTGGGGTGTTGGANTGGSGVSVNGGQVSTTFQVNAIQAGGSTLLVPDSTTGVPLDFDSNGKGQRCVIDSNGNMTLNGAAYTGNGKHSNQKFVRARWSPDGRWLAYIVQRPDAAQGGQNAMIDDGLWYVDTANANAAPVFVMRNTVERIAYDINWANDSDAMMISVRRPNGPSSVLVGKGIKANDTAPGLFTLLNYIGGTWNPDFQAYVGTTPPDFNEGVKLGIVGRDIGKIQNIADGAGYKVWMQNPAKVPDGRYLFLGKPSEDGKLHGGATSLMLYAMWPDQPPSQLTPPLSGEVIYAQWSPNRTALVVSLKVGSQIQTKVLTMDGTVLDFTSQGRGSPGVHWGY
jgi:hypothetical protein